MSGFEKLMVCLDLTEMDHFLIDYSGFLIDTFNPAMIVFIHVMEAYDIPDEILDTMYDSDEALEDIVKKELEERVNSGLTSRRNTEIEIVVEKGLTTEKVVQYSRKNKIDLCVIGKKLGYSGQGSVARKIVGLLPSSVLVVSETSRKKINKILVRMDFSPMAFSTLLKARVISEYTGANVECHHVYKLPLHYYPRQTPEIVKKMKIQLGAVVEREYQKFIKQNKIDDAPPITYSLDLQSDESQLLYNHAIKNGIDLIITGSRIKSPLANIILDSTSEKLVGGEKSIPVMVVKDHKRSVGILKAIFDLKK